MKIISNKECYVQGYDLENIINNEHISFENRFCAANLLNDKNLNEYVNIKDKDLLEFILSNDDILDFSVYNNYSLGKLTGLSLKLWIDIMNIDEYDNSEDSIDSILYREDKKKKEYLLSQIKQIIAYKKKESKCNFPNIPNPCTIPLSCGNLCASRSLDFDNVLIYNLDGTPISGEEDKEFCNIAYQLLMHDELCELEEEKIDLESSVSKDEKYLTISRAKEKSIQRNYRKRN